MNLSSSSLSTSSKKNHCNSQPHPPHSGLYRVNRLGLCKLLITVLLYIVNSVYLYGWHGNQKTCLGRTKQSVMSARIDTVIPFTTPVATSRLSLMVPSHCRGDIEKTFIIMGVTVHTAKILNNICTQTTSS